ncbi:Pentatricopeptide repeat [Trema orientale]|uniref:Pentatricopeptide repeat n=1 Tax=Trema orientale TaxID=63057 RepID=A0A2P5DWH8_TREOI|nr:Pentatricopeptide repeat [Trema orientale]
MVLEVKVEATAGLSGALLGAARIHRNMELVKYAIEKLSELEPHKASNDVLLSNIHAEIGRWIEVERIRVMMSKRKNREVTRMQLDRSWKSAGPMRLRSFSKMGAYVFNQNLKITQLGKSGRIAEAIKVFSQMTRRNIVTYNSMISEYAKNGGDQGCAPSRLFSWTLMITSYTRNGELQNARELFNLLPDKQDSVCWNAMIAGYTKKRLYEEAKNLFYEMPVKNFVSWNSMLAGYTKNGEMRIRLLFFKEIARRDVLSWNLIVDGFVEVGDLDSSWLFFKEISELNVVSWVTMLCGFARNGWIVEAQDLFKHLCRNMVSLNAMIAAYVQDSQIDRAVRLFSEMPEWDSGSWTTMINGYLCVGSLMKQDNYFIGFLTKILPLK